MVAEMWALAAMGLIVLAEWLHARRCRRVARLAFGPKSRSRSWTRLAPLLRIVAIVGVTWGLVSLWLLDPKVHGGDVVDEKRMKQLLIVLDVSPSMLLDDAGPQRNQPRRQRASEVMTALLNRLPIREYRVSLIAFYTEAKPLLEESADLEVLKYIFEDLPTYLGFKAGKTDLFAGLELAAQTAKKWRPRSTTMIVISDGVTVPASGMPRLPASIGNVLVVGVGDPFAGKFIDGHQSRQDTATLRQLANRLDGVYHDGNTKHVPSGVVSSLRHVDQEKVLDWNRRELALAFTTLGAAVIAMLPWMLRWFGTSWTPGAAISAHNELRLDAPRMASAIVQEVHAYAK